MYRERQEMKKKIIQKKGNLRDWLSEIGESALHIPLFQIDKQRCRQKLIEVLTLCSQNISVMQDYGPLQLLWFHL